MPSINVSSSAGTHVTGLTVGHIYDLSSSGGPWHPHGIGDGTDDTYAFRTSLNGSSWDLSVSTPTDPLSPQNPPAKPSWVAALSYLDASHVNLHFAAAQTDVWVGVADSVYSDNTGSLDYALHDVTDYCTYGSRVQSSYTSLLYLDPSLLITLVGAVTEGWAWPLVAFFSGQLLNIGQLCALPRPEPKVITVDDMLAIASFPPTPDSIAAVSKAWDWLRWAAWPKFCECVPGSPAPTSPPVLVDPGPAGAPPGPLASFSCDNTDLCTQIQALTIAVAGLAQSQRQIGALVTLMQRQDVPFAYIPGTVHAGLTGSGEFSVLDILGLSVEFTTLPAWIGRNAADPQDFEDLGEISVGGLSAGVGSPLAFERHIRLTHAPELILGISGAVTRVGYYFNPTTVATITELVREA